MGGTAAGGLGAVAGRLEGAAAGGGRRVGLARFSPRGWLWEGGIASYVYECACACACIQCLCPRETTRPACD